MNPASNRLIASQRQCRRRQKSFFGRKMCPRLLHYQDEYFPLMAFYYDRDQNKFTFDQGKRAENEIFGGRCLGAKADKMICLSLR